MVVKKRFLNGDIFAIPVDEKCYCFGQIVDISEGLYAIFNFFSDKLQNADEIINNSIIFLVQSFDLRLKQGVWEVLGNTVIRDDTLYPEYKLDTPQGYVVVNYKGEVLRKATGDEVKKLYYREAVSLALLENAIKSKYGIEEWDEDFNSFTYKSSR